MSTGFTVFFVLSITVVVIIIYSVFRESLIRAFVSSCDFSDSPIDLERNMSDVRDWRELVF
jgi:hypothetical protein